MGLLRQLFYIEGVNQAMHRHHDVSLFIIGVDSLTDSYEPNAGKVEISTESDSVSKAPRNSASVVYKNHVDNTRGCFRRSEKLLEAGTIKPGPRNMLRH
jgi:hypothetical protein